MSKELTKKYFNTAEASKLLEELGIPFTPGTLAVWRSRKEGPEYVKVRNRIFYHYDSLVKFANSGLKVRTIC